MSLRISPTWCSVFVYSTIRRLGAILVKYEDTNGNGSGTHGLGHVLLEHLQFRLYGASKSGVD